MCSLCGILGCDDHWTSAVARPGVYSRNTDSICRRREAMRRQKFANALLEPHRLKLADWQGTSYMLSNATGSTRIFESIAHLWPEAEVLGNADLDPLDEAFLDRLETL